MSSPAVGSSNVGIELHALFDFSLDHEFEFSLEILRFQHKFRDGIALLHSQYGNALDGFDNGLAADILERQELRFCAAHFAIQCDVNQTGRDELHE